jgi:hypothetical protein
VQIQISSFETEENKQRTQRPFDEEFNKGNSAVIDEMIAADYVDHSSLPAPAPGPDGFKKPAALLRAAFNPSSRLGGRF